MSDFSSSLVDQINAVLPQTQCTQCGYNGCLPYAQAIAEGVAPINQCPPGGQAGITKLADVLNQPNLAQLTLNLAHGVEQLFRVAFIDEQNCIGCTLCIQACPVDAIVGANKMLHTVREDICTGCNLCVPPCPVDCITMQPPVQLKVWAKSDAVTAKQHYERRNARLIRIKSANEQRLAQKLIAKSEDFAAHSTLPAEQLNQKRALLDQILHKAQRIVAQQRDDAV